MVTTIESPADAARFSEPEVFLALQADKLVVLDEVQRLRGLFATLRSVIDKRRRAGRRAGQFLLLGSASGALLQQSSESLAGRLATLELTTRPAHPCRDPAPLLDHAGARTGAKLHASKIAAALAVSGQTVARYLDLMCDLIST